MQYLSSDWFTHGLLDFEYKKYRLLAYLSHVRQAYSRHALYPVLSDLRAQHAALANYKAEKDRLSQHFPKQLAGADLQNFRLIYKKKLSEDACSETLEEFTAFALPQLEAGMQEGSQLQMLLEEAISFEPIGLLPLYRKEGYLMLEQEGSASYGLYRFRCTNLKLQEQEQQVRLMILENRRKSAFQRTAAQLKLELVRQYPDLPNPPLFRLVMHVACPLEEALLPLACRRLARELAAA